MIAKDSRSFVIFQMIIEFKINICTISIVNAMRKCTAINFDAFKKKMFCMSVSSVTL